MTEIESTLRKRCFKASLLGFRFVTQPVLVFVDGAYVLPDSTPELHPLEYFLLIADVSLTGDWRDDVAHVLGVSSDWVDGFVNGFAGDEPSTDTKEYNEGFRCGRAVADDWFEMMMTRKAPS